MDNKISGILLRKWEDPMRKKYLVTLTEAERTTLHDLTKKGKVAARKLTRAHVLLQADAGATDDTIAAALHIGRATVERIRKRFVEQSLDAALSERPRLGASASWMGKPRLHWSPGLVAARPMIAPAGPNEAYLHLSLARSATLFTSGMITDVRRPIGMESMMRVKSSLHAKSSSQ
jgi:Homeodomain-like domain